MEQQRERARSRGGVGGAGEGPHDRVIGFVARRPESRFIGYEDLGPRPASPPSSAGDDGEVPGQARGEPLLPRGRRPGRRPRALRWPGGEAEVVDVYRVGADQALKVRGEAPEAGSRVEAEVARFDRHATMRNHTATHLLHAALRERLGTHVRQAGSAVRPDKLRFDFTHGSRLSPEDLAAIGDRVNGWIKDERAGPRDRDGPQPRPSGSARWRCSARSTATGSASSRSRASRASSAAAPTSPAPPRSGSSRSSRRARAHRTSAGSRPSPGPPRSTSTASAATSSTRAAEALGGRDDAVAAAERLGRTAARARGCGRRARCRSGRQPRRRAGRGGAETVAGIGVVVGELGELPARSRCSAPPTTSSRAIGDAAVVLAATSGEKVSLVGVFSPAAVERGLSAADVVREAAAHSGRRRRREAGGRSGRGTPSRQDRRCPERSARSGPQRTRRRSLSRVRVLAIDHGAARCGCALSDPSGTIVRPIDPVGRPIPPRSQALVAEHGVETVVVGLPVSLDGTEGGQAAAARAFADELAGPARRPGRDLRRAADDEDGRRLAARRIAGRRGLARSRAPARHLADRPGGAPMSDEPEVRGRPSIRSSPTTPPRSSASAVASSARRGAGPARRAASRSASASAAPSTAPPRRAARRSSRPRGGPETARPRRMPPSRRAFRRPRPDPARRRVGADRGPGAGTGRARRARRSESSRQRRRRQVETGRWSAEELMPRRRSRRPEPAAPASPQEPPASETDERDWLAEVDGGAPPTVPAGAPRGRDRRLPATAATADRDAAGRGARRC